jgi:hypothetical protein
MHSIQIIIYARKYIIILLLVNNNFHHLFIYAHKLHYAERKTTKKSCDDLFIN